MEILKLQSSDIGKEKLQMSQIKEKLENQKDLKNLYDQIVGFGESKEKTINDLSGLKNYLSDIKDKSWEDIKKEGSSRSFAVQLFLKSEGLYAGKIDGLYMTKGKADKTLTRAAVKKFQQLNGMENKADGWAGPDTIKKMFAILDKKEEKSKKIIDTVKLPSPDEIKKPEKSNNNPNDIKTFSHEDFMKTPVSTFEIGSDYQKLSIQQQKEFRGGKYTIVGERYSYKFVNDKINRTKNK